jgi:hypothetical protein
MDGRSRRGTASAVPRLPKSLGEGGNDYLCPYPRLALRHNLPMRSHENAEAVISAESSDRSEASTPDTVYVFYGQDLGPNVGLGDLERAQQWLRAVVASSLRVSMLPFIRDVPKDIYAPLNDPLVPLEITGSLEVIGSIYGNPWWEIIQTALPFATFSAVVAAGFKHADRLIEIMKTIAMIRDDVGTRRAKLRANAAEFRLNEMQALAEQAALGEELRRMFSEGGDLEEEVKHHGDKRVAEAINAATLMNSVATMPIPPAASPTVIEVLSAEQVLGIAQALRELAASQDLGSKTSLETSPGSPESADAVDDRGHLPMERIKPPTGSLETFEDIERLIEEINHRPNSPESIEALVELTRLLRLHGSTLGLNSDEASTGDQKSLPAGDQELPDPPGSQ